MVLRTARWCWPYRDRNDCGMWQSAEQSKEDIKEKIK